MMNFESRIFALALAVTTAALFGQSSERSVPTTQPSAITGGNILENPTIPINSTTHQQQQLEGRLVDLQSYVLRTPTAIAPAPDTATPGISSSLDRAPLASAAPTSTNLNNSSAVANRDPGLLASDSGTNSSAIGAPANSGSSQITTANRVESGSAARTSAPVAGQLTPVGAPVTPPDRTPGTPALATGGPVAVISNGQVYTVLISPSALAAYLNQDVRLSGQVYDQYRAVLPSQIEVRRNGTYQNAAVSGLPPAAGLSNTRTAQDH